ncbi:MAG: hypothetical protein QOH46_1213 [Solirubrobacteraceae bacterium]|nr:hypothetical protein [Solirubrobacteraceae bacterium]
MTSLCDAVLESAPDAIITLDEDARVVGVNAAAERIFGFERSHALGQPVSEIVAPAGPAVAGLAGLAERMRSDAPECRAPFEVHARRSDGTEINVELALTLATRDPPRFTAWIREGSALGASPEAVRRRALLETAEEVAQAGSWEWTPDDGELLWSDNLFRIFGVEPGATAPTPEYVFSHTHPDDRDRVSRVVAELKRTGTLTPLDYRILRPDGVVRHLRATLAVSEWRSGTPHRLVGWVQDDTERRRAEREIAAHYAVATALSEWESLEPGAERLIGHLADAMDFVAGVLWIPRDEALVARVIWHSSAVELPEYEAVTARTHLRRGVGLPGRVWDQREPINLPRVPEEALAPRREAALREGLRGAVAIPAITGEEVLAVVELVSREEAELTDRLMRSLTGIGHELGQFLSRRRGELEPPVLTPRETEVLRLAAQGLSVPRTAERLFISPATVKTHIENIYAKLGVGDKASAVASALRLGLIE